MKFTVQISTHSVRKFCVHRRRPGVRPSDCPRWGIGRAHL